MGNNSSSDPFLFTEHERDSETGDDYTMFRQYSSTQGRWTSPDPYSGSYSLTDPQSMNRYAYVTNRPMNAVDEDGEAQCDIDCGNGSCQFPTGGLPGTGGGGGGGGGGSVVLTAPDAGNTITNTQYDEAQNGYNPGILAPDLSDITATPGMANAIYAYVNGGLVVVGFATYESSDTSDVPGNGPGVGPGVGPKNPPKTQQPDQQTPPDCGSAIAEMAMGGLVTAGEIATLYYLARSGEIEALDWAHIGPMLTPGPMMISDGWTNWENCH